jgi:hypothetical protein
VHKKAFACFIVLFCLAAAMRFTGITFDSLWLDEGYQSLVEANGRQLPDLLTVAPEPFLLRFSSPADPQAVVSNLRRVDPLCPPIYAIVLNVWMHLFGQSDLAVRSLSVLFSLASLAALFVFGLRFFGLRVAAAAALFEAISPFDIRYAQEVRMYSLVELTACLSSTLLIYLFLAKPQGARLHLTWLAYAFSAWALINSHYTGLFILAFQVSVAIFWGVMGRAWKSLAVTAAAWLLVFLAWIPWLGLFLQAAALRTASFYVSRTAGLIWPFWALLIKIPSNWVVFLSGQHVMPYAVPLFLSSFLFIAAGFAMVFGKPLICRRLCPIAARREPEGVVARQARWLVLLWAIVPAVVLWILDVKESHKVIEIPRYLMGTAPAIYLIAGWGLSSLNFRKTIVKLIILIHISCAVANDIAHATVFHEREPWRRLARLVDAEVPKNELILVSQWYDIVCLNRYLEKPHRQVGVSPPMGKEHLVHVLSGSDEFVLITAQEGEAITQLLPANVQQVRRVDLEHGLHLRFYKAVSPH